MTSLGFEGVWGELAAGAAPSAGYLAKRILPESPLETFAAVLQPVGRRALLFETSSEAIPVGFQLPSASGFESRLEAVTAGSAGRARIALIARDAVSEPVFATVASDVAESVGHALTTADGLTVIVQRLELWRRFFAAAGAGGLSQESLQGLWGELHTLAAMCESRGRAEALAAWVGPTRSNHDFEWPSESVEIKTCSAAPPVAIRIANPLQLQLTGEKPLVLVVHLVDRTPAGGVSVPEQVAHLRQLLLPFPEAARRLDDQLIRAGYLDAHASKYEAMRFALRRTERFEVRPGFPRLTEEDLPNGVGDVSYSVSLDACIPWQIRSEPTPAERQ